MRHAARAPPCTEVAAGCGLDTPQVNAELAALGEAMALLVWLRVRRATQTFWPSAAGRSRAPS